MNTTRIANACNNLNTKWSACGRAKCYTWKEYVVEFKFDDESMEEFCETRNIEVKVRDEDVVVDYDFCTDELSDEDREKFSEDIGHLFRTVAGHPNEIYEFDGSGNGLYYGCTIFRS